MNIEKILADRFDKDGVGNPPKHVVESIKCAMREAIKESIQHLKDQHPYPKDVFPDVDVSEIIKIANVLSENGFSYNAFVAHSMRIGYESAIAKLEEL